MAQSITLQTSDSDIISSDVLGRLSFAASSESSGSDAVLIGASIYAMAESDFTEISNATSIIFATASSESAIAKLKISSQGHFLPILDKTYDIGASGTKFRNIYAENGKFENISISNLSDPYEILYITDSSGNVSSTDLLKVDLANSELDLNADIVGTGNINISGNLTANSGLLDQIVFNTSLDDPNLTAGQLQWNSTEGTLDLGLNDNYAMHIGEEMLYRVRNITGSTLLAGQPVYASGLSPGANNRIEVNLYAADGSIREVRFMGLMTEDLTDNGNNGYATHFGYIRGVDTRGNAAVYGTTNKLWSTGEPAWNIGDILYVHPTVPGKLTKIEPKHSISVAIITNVAQNGKIFVRPTSYGHLDDNHDVDVSGATNGQFLQYNSATDYWVPSSSGNFTTLQLNGTTVSVSGHTHTSSDITNFNSSVSGLLPTIANSGDNRILTSTGSSVGINAESNLTFDGNLLNVVGSGSFSSNLNLSSQTVNTIAGFDGSKNIVSLPTSTYPSFTELSYVKGVTSSIQTQLNSKAPTASPTFTGTLTAAQARVNGSDSLTVLLVNGGTKGVRFNISAASSAIEGVDNGGVSSYQPLVVGGSTLTLATAGVSAIAIDGSQKTTLANQLLVTAGSASACGVAFSGDPDTGIAQLGGANTLSFVTNGAERLQINADGNAILTRPGEYALVMRRADTGVTNNFISAITYDAKNASGTYHSYCRLITQQTDATDGTESGQFYLQVRNNGTERSYVLIDGESDTVKLLTGGSERLLIDAVGDVSMTQTYYNLFNELSAGGGWACGYNLDVDGSTVERRFTGAISAIVYASDSLRFFCSGSDSAGTAPTERVRVDANGNVGIGTSSPSNRLHVQGGELYKTTTDFVFGTTGSLVTTYHGASTGNTYGAIGALSAGGSAWNNLVLQAGGGNVGIGTTTVSYRLHVVGNASANNNVVCYLNNTGSTRSRLAFQDTSTTYAPDISSIGNDIVFDTVGIEALRIDSDRNLRINGAAKGTSAVGCIHIKNGTAPSASITDGIILFAADISSSSELRVRDEVGNVTTLSPHAFPLIPEGPSEDMAWSYYSERDGKKINIDMLKAIRLLEKLTGEKLVYTA